MPIPIRPIAMAICALTAGVSHAQLRTPASAQSRTLISQTPRTIKGLSPVLNPKYRLPSIAVAERGELPIPEPAPSYVFAMPAAHPYVVEIAIDWETLGRRPADFTFDFGDGQRAPASRVLQHDYRPAMNHRNRETRFDTRLIDQRGNVVEARILTIASPIAMSREMGFVQAEMVPPRVEALSCPVRVEAVITNHEPETVTYTRFLRTFQPCMPGEAPIVQDTDLETAVGSGVIREGIARPGVLGNRRQRAQPGLLELRSGRSTRLQYTIPCEKAANMCVASWTLVGRTHDGRKAYADFHAEIGRNSFRAEASSRQMTQFLNELITEGLVANPDQISSDTLRTLALEGHITQTPDGWEVIK